MIKTRGKKLRQFKSYGQFIFVLHVSGNQYTRTLGSSCDSGYLLDLNNTDNLRTTCVLTSLSSTCREPIECPSTQPKISFFMDDCNRGTRTNRLNAYYRIGPNHFNEQSDDKPPGCSTWATTVRFRPPRDRTVRVYICEKKFVC